MNIILLDDPRWKDFFPAVRVRIEGTGEPSSNQSRSKRLKMEPLPDFLVELENPDPRYLHIVRHLKKQCGESVRVGFLHGGPIGEANVTKIVQNRCKTKDNITLKVQPDSLRAPPPRPLVRLLLGVPFPRVVKQLWPVLASFAVESVVYAPSDLTNPAYLKTSSLVESEYDQVLRDGLSQAEETRMPQVSVTSKTVLEIAQQMGGEDENNTTKELLNLQDLALCKLVLHVGGTFPSIRQCFLQRSASGNDNSNDNNNMPFKKILLAIGPERGWTDTEIQTFQKMGFRVASLGSPILKTETAVVAGISLARDVLLEHGHVVP